MSPPTVLVLSLLAALPGAPSRASAAGTAVAAHAEVASSADDFLVTLLLVGLAGVAAIALIGTGFLLARRERVKEPPPSAMAQAAAALERRSVRRSKVRLSDDPIVAALGIDEDDRRHPRRRARPVVDTDDPDRTPPT
ncbi:MAG TPA: hypothetical protein VJ975_09015 [Candidatus Limnocylindria bacterium]|nr:hypothetical protein [Candidatus Limnocylindria bacterium]